jgi:hypothetical protein
MFAFSIENRIYLLRGPMITVKLVGGLGNQLFGYFLGQSLGVNVRYDVSDQTQGLSAQSVSIKDLNLNGDFGVFENRLSSLFGDKFRVLKRIVRKLDVMVSKILFRGQIYESACIGFDPFFQTENLKFRKIRGYFQSYVYFRKTIELKPELANVSLRHPSSWYESMAAEIQIVNPIAIHIRRGDYLKYADNYGLLSENYYLKAIELAEHASNEKSDIWIFSDSPEQVRKNMPRIMSRQSKLILSPDGISDAEVMLLMSLCKKIVIANSTFSWWAATLNTKSKTVIAPNKWFKGMEDPSTLIPETWLTLESDWL